MAKEREIERIGKNLLTCVTDHLHHPCTARCTSVFMYLHVHAPAHVPTIAMPCARALPIGITADDSWQAPATRSKISKIYDRLDRSPRLETQKSSKISSPSSSTSPQHTGARGAYVPSSSSSVVVQGATAQFVPSDPTDRRDHRAGGSTITGCTISCLAQEESARCTNIYVQGIPAKGDRYIEDVQRRGQNCKR